MGKTVYCISNGSQDMFPNNTLTSFGNKFPFMYDYGIASNNYKFQVGVDAIGFSLNFTTNLTGRSTILPSIILQYPTTTKLPTKCYHLNDEDYTICDSKTEEKVLKNISDNSNDVVSYRFIYFETTKLNYQNVCKIFRQQDDILTLYCNEEKSSFLIKYRLVKFKVFLDLHLLTHVLVRLVDEDLYKGESEFILPSTTEAITTSKEHISTESVEIATETEATTKVSTSIATETTTNASETASSTSIAAETTTNESGTVTKAASELTSTATETATNTSETASSTSVAAETTTNESKTATKTASELTSTATETTTNTSETASSTSVAAETTTNESKTVTKTASELTSTATETTAIASETVSKVAEATNYRVYECSANSKINIDFSDVLSLNYPKIIKIRCKNIRDQIFNNSNEKDLLVFCPEIEKSNNNSSNYFFHEFETRTYCTLENTILDHIYFELLNEHDKPLQLEFGIPTVLKLDIKAMEKNKKSFNVRIASDLNNRSNFSIMLPQTLYFNEKWRVSLTSINLPNTFTTFNTDKPLKIIFKYQSGDYATQAHGHKGDAHYDKKVEFEVPKLMTTVDELLKIMNKFFSSNVDEIDIARISEYMPNNQQTKRIKLTMNYHGVLEIPEEIVMILGSVDTYFVSHSHGYFHFIHVHPRNPKKPPKLTSRRNPLNADGTLSFSFLNPPNINYYKPSYIMLYSDLIQPIPVSGIYMNILKIFPISPEEITYVIKEFKNPEYLMLNNYEVKEMNFQLRNHTGEFISFDENNRNPIILNLHFTNYY
jgi:hypothetical protein